MLQSGQQFLEAKEVGKRDQLKFLLQSGKILTNSIFYRSRNPENALTIVTHAKQLATLIRNEQGEADALDLLDRFPLFAGPKPDGERDPLTLSRQQRR